VIRSRLFITYFALLLVLAGLSPPPTAAAGHPPLRGKVSWVYDGDTIAVNGLGKVRLLGIDAPEHEDSERDRFYRRWDIPPQRLRSISRSAVAYLIRTAKGREVTLVLDREPRDRYGRLLAYVYLPDGALLNRTLLEQGYASVFRKYDFRLKTEFLAAEQRARKDGVGLWKKGRP
jgi:micrococcal nuclease